MMPEKKGRFRFSKEERLHSKKHIDLLFRRGKVVRSDLLSVVYLLTDEIISSTVQVMISIPKKHVKRAVDRNLLKRRIREAYRLNKHILLSSSRAKNKKIMLGIIYNGSVIEAYDSIEKSVRTVLEKLERKVAEL